MQNEPNTPIRPPLRAQAGADATGRLAALPRHEGASDVSHREPAATATAQPAASQAEPALASPRGLPRGSGAQEQRDARFAELEVEIAAQKQAKAQRCKKAKRKSQSPPLPPRYRRQVIRTALEHRKKFKALFAADLTIRDRGARLYRSLLSPQPRGKKPGKSVRKALGLIKKLGRKPRRTDWPGIDRQCPPEPGARLDPERRRFHHTVRVYLSRHKIKLE